MQSVGGGVFPKNGLDDLRVTAACLNIEQLQLQI